MKVRVRFAATFRIDYRRQLEWLRIHREPSWLEGLRSGIDEARQLVTRFPAAGNPEGTGTEEGGGLRKLVLRRMPYVIWYALDDRGRDVWFLRLFHARQDRLVPGEG